MLTRLFNELNISWNLQLNFVLYLRSYSSSSHRLLYLNYFWIFLSALEWLKMLMSLNCRWFMSSTSLLATWRMINVHPNCRRRQSPPSVCHSDKCQMLESIQVIKICISSKILNMIRNLTFLKFHLFLIRGFQLCLNKTSKAEKYFPLNLHPLSLLNLSWSWQFHLKWFAYGNDRSSICSDKELQTNKQ